MVQTQRKLKRNLYLFTVLVVIGMLFLLPLNIKAAPTLKKTNLTLQVGKSKSLKVTGTGKRIKWSSNQSQIVSVSAKGKVTAKSKGDAVITAKVGGKKLTCKVLVYNVSYGDEQVKAKCCSIINKNITADMSVVEKIKVIHDYMVLNCEYDYNNYLKKTVPRESYTPRGALINKKSVCQGYAETFQLFMNSLDIPCQIVTGTANGGGHAWNVVKIKNKWYHIDVTWDDPVPDEKGRIRYRYFLIPDKVMEQDHNWNRAQTPKCTSGSNKFISLFGTVSQNESQAMENLYLQYIEGKTTMTLICTKQLSAKYSCAELFLRMLGTYQVEQQSTENYCSYSSFEYGDYVVYTMSYK